MTQRKRRLSYAEAAAAKHHIPECDSESSEGSDSKSKVKVVVRIRPENKAEREAKAKSRCVVQAMNDNVLVFDPKEQQSPEYGYRKRHRRRDITSRAHKDLKFAFDRVFGPESSNSDVYQETNKYILGRFLNGFNCSGILHLFF